MNKIENFSPEEKSTELDRMFNEAYKEIDQRCEVFGNYLRNIVASLRAGTAKEKDVRILLRDEIDGLLYSVQHLDDKKHKK